MGNSKVLGLVGLLLLVWVSLAGAQEVAGRWGIGILWNYDAPAFGLRDWYSGTSKIGGTFIYVSSPTRAVEVEYHRAEFTHGSIEEKEFEWAADGNRYLSPEASAEMTFSSVLVNAVLYSSKRGIPFSAARYTPYLVVGGGFYGYEHKVSGLIYPGQKTKPLDPDVKLEPFSDTRKALGANLGLGVEAFVTSNVSIDLRARYNFIVGELRPMEAWGLKRVFPIQSADVGACVKFYFWE